MNGAEWLGLIRISACEAFWRVAFADDKINRRSPAPTADEPTDKPKKPTDHGQERQDEARTNSDREVGDPNRVVREGRKSEIAKPVIESTSMGTE